MISMNTVVKSKDLGMAKILRGMTELSNIDIKIGVQAGERTADGKFDLASVASIQEFGLDEKNIPSRPFMRETFDTKARAVASFGGQVANRVVGGAISARIAADLVGLKMAGFIQAKIVSGSWTPNTAHTIRRKGSSKPLIDSGHLRQSIRHVLAVR